MYNKEISLKKYKKLIEKVDFFKIEKILIVLQ